MLTVIPEQGMDQKEQKRMEIHKDHEHVGYVSFHHNGFILMLDELLPLPDDPDAMDHDLFVTLDTAIRALGSYGLNHSCFYVECHNPILYPTLAYLRFSMQDGVMKSNLQQLLKSCGC